MTCDRIAIIGLGYVGLTLANLCIEKDFEVIGIDLDENKIQTLKSGKTYLSDVSDQKVKTMLESNKFTVTMNYAEIRHAGTVIICVPTPIKNKEPDLSYVTLATTKITDHLQKDQLIILESSTFPGTTDEIIHPILKKNGFQIGHDLFLAYSPERVDPGNKEYLLHQIPKVVSGVTEKCLQKVQSLYKRIFDRVISVTNTRTAEFVKMLENSQRFINISFVNEMNIIATKIGVDIWEVIEAAKTKPFGFTPYYPGPGVGGHCIPVDPFYLTWLGMKESFPLTMIHQADLINDLMPHFVVSRVAEELAKKNKDVNQSKIGIIGLTYKKDVNDVRESPSLKVINLLRDFYGVDVYAYDPLIKNASEFANPFTITYADIQKLDIVVILVDHANVPWDKVVEYSKLILDTRNVIKNKSLVHVSSL